ncbi:MAG: rod shape-determining protein MreC [Bacteroidales bacterium]|nr:rod shape-determining protein MreC [Bacteroidales bacterium]
MRNLIAFLWKNYFFFLFVILEVAALFLIVNNNYYQQRVFINSTSDFTGNLIEKYNNFTSYFALKNANKILVEENTRFYNMSPKSFIKTDTSTFFVNDSLYTQQYKYRSAKVISNSINRRNNYLKLNKGSLQGIKPDMAVVATGGIVGQVIEVSDHFSSVMSILNSNARVSAKLRKSNQVGSLFWDGQDYKMGKLVDIPSHVRINIGDTVVTSGYSYTYPEGRIVGVVEGFNIEEGESFFEVDVRFSVDFNNLSYVYVIQNLFKGELIQLEQSDYTE